jgi:glycosyltransferase involved in cell wall biosynthesis
MEAELTSSRGGSGSLIIHIPTPGDHYSPATGSATMTVIREMALCHAAAGGETRVIVNRGTRQDYDPTQCLQVEGREYPAKWKRAADQVLTRLGMGRPLWAALYQPHLSAVPQDFGGPLLIHNGPAAIRLARKLRPNAKLGLWMHNDVFRTYGDSEVRGVAAAADWLICCSRFIADGLAARLPGELRKRVHVVHNGVDTEQFQPPPVPPRNDPPVILFVGRVQSVKGPDLLIKAAAKLAAEGIRFLVRIVGSQNFSATDPLTPYEKELRQIAEPLGDRVQFLPFTDRAGIVAAYQAADINVVPSNWDEPFGLTVLEGLASGLPSVVSRRGGIPEAAGEAALYFDPPDVDQLAEQLRNLLTDASLRDALSKQARARALEMNWKHSYRQLHEVISTEN